MGKRNKSQKRKASFQPHSVAEDATNIGCQHDATKGKKLEQKRKKKTMSTETALASNQHPNTDKLDETTTDDVAAAPKTVHFNVGGTLYEVSHSLLEQHENTMLARMASAEWQGEKDTGEPLFIERDSELFRFVLQFMRDGRVCLPARGVSKASFHNELVYYGFVDIPPETITIDCIAGDSIRYLQSLNEGYKRDVQELRDLNHQRNTEAKQKIEQLNSEWSERLQALKAEFSTKIAEAERIRKMKDKELLHQEACLGIVNWFFQEFQGGREFLVLTMTDWNDEKVLAHMLKEHISLGVW